jgi:hypothetical protein
MPRAGDILIHTSFTMGFEPVNVALADYLPDICSNII